MLDSLLTILHLGENFSNLSRTPTNHHANSANDLHHYSCLRTLHKRSSYMSFIQMSSIELKQLERYGVSSYMIELSSRNHLGKHV